MATVCAGVAWLIGSGVLVAQNLPPMLTPSATLLPRESAATVPGSETVLQPVLPGLPGGTRPPLGARKIRLFQRSTVPTQARLFQSEDGREWIAVVTHGVTMVIEEATEFGTLELSADRVVVWTGGMEGFDLTGETIQNGQTPLEVYLEGNIVFRQGDRTLFAERMYYNVAAKNGVILDAQVYTPIPKYAGIARLRADVIRQVDANNFTAQEASVTTSRLGIPAYWFQSNDVTFRDLQRPLVNPQTGLPEIDPVTGQPIAGHQQLVTGKGNTVYVENTPIFYWPSITTDLQRPSFYLTDVRIRQDNVFGTQVYTTWDLYQIFGIQEPPTGTEWEGSADYLSERGPAGGTAFKYDRFGFLGIDGPAKGRFDAWGIKDDGVDNLGRDRRALVPEEEFRGRVFWQHRHRLSETLTLSAELGFISDRNFLEQYFEHEWDEWKDQTTGVELKQHLGNSTWSISGNARVNDFFTQNQWLPRADHYWLGESLLWDRLTWYEHTSIGYARFRTATTPTDMADAAKFDPLEWEFGQRNGERVVTRQELDLPFSLGYAQVVPYALGELGHWGEDVTQDDVQRAYGQVGVRASIPMWAVNPEVRSELLNLHGLAHKVTWDGEFLYAQANRDVGIFPLYDELDDDSVEHFRRRFFFDTFGGTAGGNTPARFDERNYAIRYGMGGFVTSPAAEVVDDLMAVRLGVRQRWQTKRGAPGAEHIIDWITLDTRATWFPNQDNDNFGQSLGLAEYDFRWHVGDRVTLVSDGIFDFFDQGQRLVSVGGIMNHPPNGSLYLGVRSLEGPISSNVLLGALTYKLSPKWITQIGASFDLEDDGNIGQSFSLARIGESFVFRTGINVDSSRGSVGAHLAIEPRFWPKSKLNRSNGARAFPAGIDELD